MAEGPIFVTRAFSIEELHERGIQVDERDLRLRPVADMPGVLHVFEEIQLSPYRWIVGIKVDNEEHALAIQWRLEEI